MIDREHRVMNQFKMALLLLVSLCFSLGAESKQTFRLDYLTLSDGLPNSSVSKIIQDSHGFMWIGTQSGLSRYDGYNFRTHMNNPFDSNSLAHNLVQTMYLDDTDRLWVGTYNGLNILDLNRDSFRHYPSSSEDSTSLSNDVVVTIEKDKNGQFWVGTLNGLNLFDEITGTFTRFFNDPEDKSSLPDNTVRSIFKDNHDNLWIGTYGGLSRWDEKSRSFINYYPEEGNKKSIPSLYIMDIKQSPYSDDIIILGSWGGGVTEFNTKTEEAVTHRLPDNRVYTMLVDSRNQLWVGTWGGGLISFSLEDGSYNHYKSGPASGLSHDIIYSLFEDASGVLWIGTNGGGINKYVDWKNQYHFYTNEENSPESLPSGRVIAAFEDSKSRLWFSVVGKGLSLFDKTTEKFKNYKYDENDPESLSNDTVNVIYEDSLGNLWVGTNEGINRYIDESDSFICYNSGNMSESLPENLINSIAEDRDNNIWLGTYTTGISVMDSKTGESRYYRNDNDDPSSISANLIRSFYMDSTGAMWIATNKGLNLYQPESDSFKRFLHKVSDRSTISNNDIRSIFEDSDGDLWIATNGGGVNLYNRKSESFSLLSVNDGLLNNCVYGIEEDKNGTLLFITQSGISLYDKTNNLFSIIDEKTGLLSSELTSGYLKASDGSYYIGSNIGITHIPILGEKNSSYVPKIRINNFSIQGVPYDNMNNPVWKLKNIVLKHYENILSFEFGLNDYSSQGKNQFAYKMEGVDTDWVYSGTRNFARYTQLKPGKYIFRVIGADSRNNWNRTGTSFSLMIQPPFWLSNFAFVLYFLMLIMIILLIILRVKRKHNEALCKIEEQKNLNLELEKRVRKRTAQIEEAREIAVNATKAKSLFLANMSHELRTPLNAIIGFSALLNETDYNSDKKHIIRSIKTAGKSLATLINDLLDLSKLEAGKMTLNYTPVEINTVLFEIRHIFDLKIKEKKLSMQIVEDKTLPDELMLDETKIRQILINLVSNAIKFTDSGLIKIVVSKLHENTVGFIDFQISVEDSGRGLSSLEKEKLFELFWQSENHEFHNPVAGTGLGLSITKNLVNMMDGEISVSSEVGSGSIFSVIFHNVAVADFNSKDDIVQKPDLLENITFKGIKALVVDDIEDNRNLLIEIMKTVEIKCASSENGKEAIIQTESFNPDIIFMDLQMPLMNGFAAAEKIKNNPMTRQIPIIAVSASSENENLKEYFSDYVVKPYFLKDIMRILKSHLSYHSVPREEEILQEETDFTMASITDFPLLLESLNEALIDWKTLKPSGRMSILENFALSLNKLGKKHKAQVLSSYSDELLFHIQQFDLTNIEKKLKEYPGIIEKIRN
jgi:signal transduction histidine kinase/ligand-binding sensor domain-containing protein/CheY-like chemotaxis protein